jgi:hypothetical protein
MIQDPHKEAEGTEVVTVAVVHIKEEDEGSKVAAEINIMAVETNLMAGETKLMEAGAEAEADQDTMEIETHGGGVMAHNNNSTNQTTKRIKRSQTIP